MKINGVVVLYKPDYTIVNNIKSYIDGVEKLFVVDNSENKNIELIIKIKNISSKCKYIDNKGNQGIARALNVGAKLAIENCADWLLTMDQDTSFNNNQLEKVRQELLLFEIDDIAIVSPSHYIGEEKKPFYNEVTMTSGNLINLKLFNEIGKFDESLFIDSVDTEYCLRIYSKSYKIKRMQAMVLNHNLGDIKEYKVLGFKFNPTNHNAIRRYYITRNRLYVWRKYNSIFPKFIKWEQKATLKELIKIILFEKNKFKKLMFSLKGYIDFKKGRFGKYER